MATVDVDAPKPKEAVKPSSWSVTAYGVADSPEDARKAARAVVDAAKSHGLRSGTAAAPGLRADLTNAGIVARPLPPDPTSAEAVKGNGLVKNTPLGPDGLPDPTREVKTYHNAKEAGGATK